jgi:hypothetical protein
VSTTLKSVISLAVIVGIAYVLISPLPEMDATFSGKSALGFFVLIPLAFLGLFFVTYSYSRLFDNAAAGHVDVLDLLCVRLC